MLDHVSVCMYVVRSQFGSSRYESSWPELVTIVAEHQRNVLIIDPILWYSHPLQQMAVWNWAVRTEIVDKRFIRSITRIGEPHCYTACVHSVSVA